MAYKFNSFFILLVFTLSCSDSGTDRTNNRNNDTGHTLSKDVGESNGAGKREGICIGTACKRDKEKIPSFDNLEFNAGPLACDTQRYPILPNFQGTFSALTPVYMSTKGEGDGSIDSPSSRLPEDTQIVSLTPGTYVWDETIIVKKTLVIVGSCFNSTKINLGENGRFEIQDGGRLILVGVTIEGKKNVISAKEADFVSIVNSKLSTESDDHAIINLEKSDLIVVASELSSPNAIRAKQSRIALNHILSLGNSQSIHLEASSSAEGSVFSNILLVSNSRFLNSNTSVLKMDGAFAFVQKSVFANAISPTGVVDAKSSVLALASNVLFKDISGTAISASGSRIFSQARIENGVRGIVLRNNTTSFGEELLNNKASQIHFPKDLLKGESFIPGGDMFNEVTKFVPGDLLVPEDQFIPGGDMFIPGGDMFIPGGDMFFPGDQFIPGGDMFFKDELLEPLEGLDPKASFATLFLLDGADISGQAIAGVHIENAGFVSNDVSIHNNTQEGGINFAAFTERTPGVYLKDPTFYVLDGTSFYENSSAGLVVHQSVENQTGRFAIQNGTFYNNSWGGAWIQSMHPANPLEVSDTNFVKNGMVGLYATGVSLVLEGSTFVQNRDIKVQIDDGPTLEHSGDGLVLSQIGTTKIISNLFYENGRFGAIIIRALNTNLSQNTWLNNNEGSSGVKNLAVKDSANAKWSGSDPVVELSASKDNIVDAPTMESENLQGAPASP